MELRLTADDYNLLLQCVLLSPEPEQVLRAGIVEGMVLRFDMPLEVCSELLIDVMNAFIATRDRHHRGFLERLVRKLADELGREGVEFEADPVGLIRRQDSYNRTPHSELGGFSPLQVHQLLASDWRQGSPGLQLSGEVPSGLLAQSEILHNARVLLAGLAQDGTRATTAGNLNRAFVDVMIAAMRWPDDYIEQVHRYNKVINESDVWLLHELRVILELAKLIARRKGRFALTRRGRAMAEEQRAGRLFVLLFETTFRCFNLAYRDRLPDMPDFQGTIAFPLAVLATEPAGWLPYRQLVPRLLLPSLAKMLPEDQFLDYKECMVRQRLLDRLQNFGLVEYRWDDNEKPYLRKIVKVRRTPLFDSLVTVDLA